MSGRLRRPSGQVSPPRFYRSGEIRRSTLPSGLRVVTEEMTGSRAFCVGFFGLCLFYF